MFRKISLVKSIKDKICSTKKIYIFETNRSPLPIFSFLNLLNEKNKKVQSVLLWFVSLFRINVERLVDVINLFHGRVRNLQRASTFKL